MSGEFGELEIGKTNDGDVGGGGEDGEDAGSGEHFFAANRIMVVEQLNTKKNLHQRLPDAIQQMCPPT